MSDYAQWLDETRKSIRQVEANGYCQSKNLPFAEYEKLQLAGLKEREKILVQLIRRSKTTERWIRRGILRRNKARDKAELEAARASALANDRPFWWRDRAADDYIGQNRTLIRG